MAEANILAELKRMGKGKSLDGLLLFGKVRCAIERPYVVGDSLEVSDVGTFAILDVFAIKCLQNDYFGNNYNGLYFSRGSMLIFINSLEWVGKVVKVAGTSFSYGVKVRQQWGAKSQCEGISALAFAKGNGYGSSKFIVVPNKIIELGNKEPELNMTPMEDFVLKLHSDNIMEFPDAMDSIMDYSAVDEYVEISEGSEIKDIKDTYHCEEDGGRIDLSEIKPDLVFHLEAQERSAFLDDVEEDIKSMSSSRHEFAKEILRDAKKAWSDDKEYNGVLGKIKDRFYKEVLGRYTERIGRSDVKGKVYADEFINLIASKPYEVDEDFKMPSASKINEMKENLLREIQSGEFGYYEDSDEGLPMLKDIESIVVAILAITTGVGDESLRSNFYSAKYSSGISFSLWLYLLLSNPYRCAMLGSSLNVVQCDCIYFSYTRHYLNGGSAQDCLESRSDLVYLKTLEEFSDKDTLVSRGKFSKSNASYPNRGKQFLKMNYFPCKKDLVELLNVMMGKGKTVALSEKEINTLFGIRWYSLERTERLIEKGVVNTLDNDLILEKSLEKEAIIYRVLIEKGEAPTGIEEDDVNIAIEEFEQGNGFRLEDLQREGVKLCMHRAAVLSGCAGSGKTTTSDCFTLCLERCLEDYNIVYVTPTGKACRRLAEVVGGVVRTIHSQFGVGLSGDGYLSDVRVRKNKEESKTIYICDEMAMCNTDLLFEVVRNLGENDIIYFLGDVKQLPPIGRGNPFYVLMQFLPCVELGVSKRAAEGSLVNYNTNLINHMSDGVVEELLYDEETFFCRECGDAQIPREITTAWSGFMNGSMNGKMYDEDDIQVISGYATPEKTFSSSNLNPILQRMLRGKDKLLFRHGEMEFYKNDRLIHSRMNSYGSQRYIEVEENTFKSVVTLGVMNGEVGKLVGITNAAFTQFVEFDDGDYQEFKNDIYKNMDEDTYKKLLELRASKEDKIRDDAGFKNDNYYYVKFKVYDTDLKRDVIVLYPARKMGNTEDEILVLGGEDLSNLDLAYCLTTHKMQGSQNKVIITPFGTTCSANFINRNMINTMFTRSQEVVCVVGSVKGIDSPITQGRRNPSKMKTNCLLEILGGE